MNDEEDRRLRAKLRKAIDEIVSERDYQIRRWGDEHDTQHSLNDWFIILSVYLGKTAQCLPPYTCDDGPDSVAQFRKRVKQLAAICAAAMEATDPTDQEEPEQG